MEYALGFSLLFGTIGYFVVRIIRNRAKIKHQNNIEIPAFLRKDTGENPIRNCNSDPDWTEILPVCENK